MKIGIITQPLHCNYGGLLQNFALQTILKRLGHTPMTVNWANDNTWSRWMVEYCKWFLRLLMKKNVNRPQKPNEIRIMRSNTDIFVDKYINTTKSFYYINAGGLTKYKFDAYVVGSDQVWRFAYNKRHINWMFLSFVKGNRIKRIAYAASFGIGYWDYPDTVAKKCSALAKKFNGISIREREGVELCKRNLGVDGTLVLDPTMLLNSEDYKEIISFPTSTETSCITAYVLDQSEEFKKFLSNMKSLLNCEVRMIGNYNAQNIKCNYKERISPSVESWLSGIQKADFIVTDSFHGTVFSIIFHKKFICIGNKDRGTSRFNSLLGMFNLEDRIVDISVMDLDEIINRLKAAIDWIRVDKIKADYQLESIEFLKKNI